MRSGASADDVGACCTTIVCVEEELTPPASPGALSRSEYLQLLQEAGFDVVDGARSRHRIAVR